MTGLRSTVDVLSPRLRWLNVARHAYLATALAFGAFLLVSPFLGVGEAWGILVSLPLSSALIGLVVCVGYFRWVPLEQAARRSAVLHGATQWWTCAGIWREGDFRKGHQRTSGWLELADRGLLIVMNATRRAHVAQEEFIAWRDIAGACRVVVSNGHAYSDLMIELRDGSWIRASLTQSGGRNLSGMSDDDIDEVVAAIRSHIGLVQ